MKEIWNKLKKWFNRNIALKYNGNAMKEFYEQSIQPFQYKNNQYFCIMIVSFLIPTMIIQLFLTNYIFSIFILAICIIQILFYLAIKKNPKQHEHLIFIQHLLIICSFILTLEIRTKTQETDPDAYFYSGFYLGLFIIVFEIGQTNILYKIIENLIIIIYVCFYSSGLLYIRVITFFQLSLVILYVFFRERNYRTKLIESFRQSKHSESQQYLIAQDVPSSIVIIAPKKQHQALTCSVQIQDLIRSKSIPNSVKIKGEQNNFCNQEIEQKLTISARQGSSNSIKSGQQLQIQGALDIQVFPTQQDSISQKEITLNTPRYQINSVINEQKRDTIDEKSQIPAQNRCYNLKSLRSVSSSTSQYIDYEVSFVNQNFLNYIGIEQSTSEKKIENSEKFTALNIQNEIIGAFEKMVVKTNVINEVQVSENERVQKASNQLSPLKVKKDNKKNQFISMNLHQVISKCIKKLIDERDEIENYEDIEVGASNSHYQPKLLDSYTNCKHYLSDTFFDIKIMQYFWEDQLCLMIIIDDISPKVLSYRRQEQEIYKQKILSQVTHNLKTPLNGIQCSIEKLQEQNISDQYCKDTKQLALNIALKNCKLLSCMIDDIIDYSCLLNQNLIPHPTNFTLIELLNEIEDLFNEQIYFKQIEFKIVCDEQISQIAMYNDYKRIVQILVNLLSNSLKYTFKGFIQMNINQECDNLLRICINDTGIGIDSRANIQSQIKINKSSPSNFAGKLIHTNYKEGIGLGLQMSKNLINILGPKQSIEINSQVNQGTSVQFYLYISLNFRLSEQLDYQEVTSQLNPNNQATMGQYNTFENHINNENALTQSKKIEESFDRITNIQENTSVNISQVNRSMITSRIKPFVSQFSNSSKVKLFDLLTNYLRGMHIMIVDDTVYNILALKILLQQVPELQIEIATNGQEAVDKYQSSCQDISNKPIQLIFMDINMPIMDGEEATRHIKKYSQSLQNIPQVKIITVSAFNLESDKERFIQAGSNYHLAKPIQMAQLVKAVQSLS